MPQQPRIATVKLRTTPSPAITDAPHSPKREIVTCRTDLRALAAPTDKDKNAVWPGGSSGRWSDMPGRGVTVESPPPPPPRPDSASSPGRRCFGRCLFFVFSGDRSRGVERINQPIREGP